jgi:signal transduction histidine kinase
MRKSLDNLVRSVGLRVEVFSSAEDFLRSKRPDVPSCLVLDVHLPGLSGLDLQTRMAEIAMQIPIIFITGHGDIPMSVRAMRSGAVAFLTKPFGDEDLIEAIQQGIERDCLARRRVAKLTEANEALRGCLDAIALVPEVDDFLGQVMAATTRQLNASSSALFLRDDESDFLILDLVFQDGRVLTPAEASFPEKLRSVRLGKRELDLAQQPAVLVNLVNGPALISHSHRSYLLGLGVKTLLIIPLIVGRRLVGSLNFRFTDDRAFRPEEIEIARALAAQTSLAVQLTRLAKTARHSAVLEERNRLAGEIHDSLAQSFAAIATQLDLASEVIEAREDDFVRYLDRAKDLARFGLAEARRTALSLEPFILDKIGLTETIEMLVERSNVPGRLQCSLSANDVRANDLPLETQHNLLRIAQEAISNAVRHANPTTILVSLRTFDSSSGPGCARCYLELQVQDNGRGISAPELMSQNGFGLINMQNRAKKIGASLDIRTNPGRGTAIVVRLPINA